MSELAPSILSADFNCLGDNIHEVEMSGVRMLHIDVMDGMFVPSISFGMPVIKSIRKESKMFFDVHLMVEEPSRYIKEFVEAGADSITVHAEACKDIRQTLTMIRESGVKTAISINPETPVEDIKEVLDQVDMVLVMGVHPGFGGQKLIPETLDKIELLKNIRQSEKMCYTIEIDGGINNSNISDIVARGADVVVAGTAVFSGDITRNVKVLKEGLLGAS